MTDEEIMKHVFGRDDGFSGVVVNSVNESRDVVSFLVSFGYKPVSRLEQHILGNYKIKYPCTVYCYNELIEIAYNKNCEDTEYIKFYELRLCRDQVLWADYEDVL